MISIFMINRCTAAPVPKSFAFPKNRFAFSAPFSRKQVERSCAAATWNREAGNELPIGYRLCEFDCGTRSLMWPRPYSRSCGTFRLLHWLVYERTMNMDMPCRAAYTSCLCNDCYVNGDNWDIYQGCCALCVRVTLLCAENTETESIPPARYIAIPIGVYE